MGRTSVFVALAFLAGLGIDSFARSSRTSAAQQTESRAADLAAIGAQAAERWFMEVCPNSQQ